MTRRSIACPAPGHLVAEAVTVLLATAIAVSCGQKAAPDLDPPSASQAQRGAPVLPAVNPASTTTAAATSTTLDPGTLPQTTDRPDAAAPEFRHRIDALWQAIVADDPDRAIPAFFPLSAYQQVKDLKDPTSDWHNRLVGAFKREIAGYHKQLSSQVAQQKPGAAPAEPQLVTVNVPAGGVQWIKEKVESNKIGYFRVLDSKLSYTINGKPFSLNIKSLISWRGQWYVVHLASM